MRREIQEELRLEVTDVVFLGFLENIFTFDGNPGHEVAAVFDARFADPTVYEMQRVPLFEEGWGTDARWIELAHLPDIPLYPDGLMDLLAAAV